ncbi:hypothetical protein EX895_003181 [Sporisorium graminicola]|uniref:ABC transporter n=1 Tax=Sporisorium graminicola TaxID=280036 RepID=A0A4U7KTY9_9BASI|nr:hypothetical protein EX895_003181 [Sporisorium graminicola]TKY88085.1 hypothetical protein EX895_003181 [Sporisorium graminicola]
MATRSTSIPAGEPTTLVIVAKSLSVMVAVVRYPLELCLHTSSPAPSTLLLSASFLNAIFSGTILRTFSLTLDTRQPAQLSLFASQAIITAFASLQTLLSTARHTSLHSQTLQDQAEGAASSPKDHPDLIRGLLARAFVLWHFPLLRRGFRAKLTYGDLYTSPPRVQAHALARLFEYHWDRACTSSKGRNEGYFRILVASVRAFGSYWLAPMLPKLVVTLAQLAQPIVFGDLIAFVSSYSQATSEATFVPQLPSRGWALAGSVFIIYGLITIFTGIYWQHVYRSTFVFRSAMIASVYRHVLHRAVPLPALEMRPDNPVTPQDPGTAGSSSPAACATQDQSTSASTAASDPVAIISADIETLATVLEQVHEIWSALITIGVASLLLYARLGLAFLVALSSIVMLLLSASLLARVIPAKQKAWFEATDKRVTLISVLMHRFEQVKINLAEAYFIQKVTALRESEIAAMRIFYRWMAQVAVLATSLMNITTLATFAVAYAVNPGKSGKPLDSATVFSALTIVNMLEAPVNNLAQNGSKLLSATASLERIQSFLVARAVPPTTDGIEKPHVVSIQSDVKGSSHQCLGQDPAPVPSQVRSWLASVNIVVPASSAASDDSQSTRLVLLHGPSGSGKTTLLRHLLRNQTLLAGGDSMPRTRGTFMVPIAFCPQDPWLFEGSIRENVILDQPFDAKQFQLALELSQLASDVDTMASRDNTKVGSEGSNLSGGQGHRVALARALYSGAKVIVLDDSLSALDAGTSTAIVQNVLHPQRRHRLLQDTTIVIASHLDELQDICSLRCSVAAWRICETLIVEPCQRWREMHGNVATEDIPLGPLGRNQNDDISGQHEDDQHNNSEEDHPSESSNHQEQSRAKRSEADDNGQTHVHANLTGIKSKPTRFFFEGTSMTVLALAFVFCVLANASTYGVQVTLEQWVKHSGHGRLQQAGLYLGLMGMLTLLSFVTFFVAALIYFDRLVVQASRNTHASALRSCLQRSISAFASISASMVVNRLSTDQFICDFEYAAALFNFVFLLVGLLASLVLIFLAAPLAAAAIPVLAAGYYYLQELYLRNSRQFRSMDLEARTALFNAIKETDQGVEVVRALGRTDWIEGRGMALIERAQMPYFARLSSLRFLRMGLYTITWILATLLAILSIALRRSSSSSSLGLALTNVTSLSVMLNSTLQTWVLLETGKVAVQRLEAIARDKVEAPHTRSESVCLDVGATAVAVVNTPCLEWREFGARYSSNGPLAAQSVNLAVPRNSKVGICGRSGSGKSTLLNSLVGTIDSKLTSGELRIHGHNINHLSLEQVRSCLSLVAQKPFVWQSSIREVLTMSVDSDEAATDAEIWSALRSVGLDNLVASTTLKLDSIISDIDVDEGGSATAQESQHGGAKPARGQLNLSRGQKQLLCMARAILQSKHRSILVLDEATSSLDHEAELMLIKTIQSQFADQTVLAVAHRLVTLLDFDQVYVMDKGRIIESGCPRDLLVQQGSVFRELAASQGLTNNL